MSSCAGVECRVREEGQQPQRQPCAERKVRLAVVMASSLAITTTGFTAAHRSMESAAVLLFQERVLLCAGERLIDAEVRLMRRWCRTVHGLLRCTRELEQKRGSGGSMLT